MSRASLFTYLSISLVIPTYLMVVKHVIPITHIVLFSHLLCRHNRYQCLHMNVITWQFAIFHRALIYTHFFFFFLPHHRIYPVVSMLITNNFLCQRANINLQKTFHRKACKWYGQNSSMAQNGDELHSRVYGWMGDY